MFMINYIELLYSILEILTWVTTIHEPEQTLLKSVREGLTLHTIGRYLLSTYRIYLYPCRLP